MARTITFDFRRGGGSAEEYLFGDLTLTPTHYHEVGTAVVLSEGTKVGLINGQATLTNVEATPTGANPAWVYRVTVTPRTSTKAWSFLVGVPEGTGTIPFKDLPRYSTPGSGITIVGGASAYQTAVANGFVGSETDWLTSLRGPQGVPGPNTVPTNTAIIAIADTPVAKVVAGSIAITTALATAISKGGGDVTIPAGSYTLPENLRVPRNVRLVGAGPGLTKLYAPSNAQKTITFTGAGSGWGPIAMEGVSLDGISLVFGETESDAANGQAIRDVEIYNCTTLPGIVVRHKAWSLRFQNVRVYNCTVGVKHDFSSVSLGSGANISYTDCMIFNCTDAAWWQDGAALDGWHASFVNCNLEHSGTSFRLTNVGDGVLDLSNQHVEGNQSSYIEADSGTVIINSIWAFEFLSSSTTKTAFFILSGTAKVSVLSGRLGWAAAASPLVKMTGTTARLAIHPSVNTHLMGVKPANFGMPGNQLAAGGDFGAHIPSGVVTGTALSYTIPLTGAGTDAVIFNCPAGDAGTYRLTWAAQITAAGVNASTRIAVNPGVGGVNVDMPTIPGVVGWVFFTAYLTSGALYVEWRHSNGASGTASGSTTHATNINRFVAMRSMTAGTDMTATRLIAESLGRP